jgi:hypothetical protein
MILTINCYGTMQKVMINLENLDKSEAYPYDQIFKELWEKDVKKYKKEMSKPVGMYKSHLNDRFSGVIVNSER